MAWTERAADRSPLVQQWRSRNVRQMKMMVDVAKRLIAEKGSGFTTQELARESGVALQTFYRHFGGKDQLLLATLEDMHTEMAARYEEAARDLPDPVARLHYYVRSVLQTLDVADRGGMTAKFITAEHWRLYQVYPDDVMHATQPIVDLFTGELRAAQEQGLLPATDVTHSAELMVMLVRSVYHQYAFATAKEPTDALIEQVWAFCLGAIGGRPAQR